MTWIDVLFESSLRTAIVAAIVGFALLALRVRATPAQLSAWTLVLVTAIVMPLLVATPALRVPIAVLPASWSGAPSASVLQAPVDPGASTSVAATTMPEASTGPATSAAIIWSWRVILVAVYLAGVAVLLVRAAIGWLMVVRLERSAIDIDEPDARGRFARYARGLGLRRAPRLAVHGRLFVPICTSVRRPAILLPDGWCEWTPAKLDAVLVHELAHIARHDTLVRRISLIYRALFWFNPLAWWLHHRIAVLGERASDEATLASGIDRTTYAEALLGFFRAPQQPRLASWHVAMARGRDAERRVEWILDWEAPMTRRVKSTMAVLVLLLVPTAIAAAVAQPVARPGNAVGSDPQPGAVLPVAVAPSTPAPSADGTGARDRDVVTSASMRAHDGRQTTVRQAAPPMQVRRAVTIATPQRGAPVSLGDGTLDVSTAGGMLTVQVRNDSTSVVKSVVLAAVVRFDTAADVPAVLRGVAFAGEHAIDRSLETSPKSFALSWSTMTMRLDPADRFSMAVRVQDSSMRAAIAAGAKIELGVVRVEFENGAPWTHDVRAAGGFDRVIRDEVQDVPDRVYAQDTPGLVLPRVIESAGARYTADAMRMKIQGTVEVEIIVREDGSVGATRIVKSLDPTYGLDDTAIAAVRGYRFTPATLDGKPVRVLTHMSIEYRLH